MHKVRTTALWSGRGRLPAAWGGLLGEQAMSLVRLSRHAGTHSLRVQACEQARVDRAQAPGDGPTPWWQPQLQRIARPRSSIWKAVPWPSQVPLALAWPQACCRQGVLAWPGATDTPALLAEVHLEAAAALDLPPADVGFDFQPAAESGTVHWAAAVRAELLACQRQVRAAGWRVLHIEPEALAVRRAAECLLGEPSLPWALPVHDWQFAGRAQRSVPDAVWQALQNSPHWALLAACGAALAVLA